MALEQVEMGANDFRLSDTGQDNTCDAARPAMAYSNSSDNAYLVAWYRDDGPAPTWWTAKTRPWASACRMAGASTRWGQA